MTDAATLTVRKIFPNATDATVTRLLAVSTERTDWFSKLDLA